MLGFLLAMVVATTTVVACTDNSSANENLVVVTHVLLQGVVESLVDDSTKVVVLMPNGADPHDFEPSAKDIEMLNNATLVVASGLDMEGGLVDALNNRVADGKPVFFGSDHVTLQESEDGELDPHYWVDPVTLEELIPDLARALSQALNYPHGIDVAPVQAKYEVLNTKIAMIMSTVRGPKCQLVTEHELLGYFASRYGCTIVGTVIPNLSSTAAVSAEHIADLKTTIADYSVGVIFTEGGATSALISQLGSEMGVKVIELPSHRVPDAKDGDTYGTYVIELASAIADGLRAN